MTSQTTRPSTESEMLVRKPLQDAIDAALPQGSDASASHVDYDGRGLKIQPLDHLEEEEDCQRFQIR